jgi:hypothetical protein
MARYIHFKDPYSAEMVPLLSAIDTSPGVCIFMDINKSTDLKYSGGLPIWGRRLNNTFNILLYANHLEKFIIKGIGDEMMLYIPDEELKSINTDNSYYALLENIYAALYLIKHHRDPDVFLQCKVSLHHCTEAYNITFFEKANDYYGKDIDLTARFMGKAINNRIVISKQFHDKVREDLQKMGLAASTGCLASVSRKRTGRFRGVPDPKEYRVIDVL